MKKFAYFTAVSLVVIAQAASAQTVAPKPGMPSTDTAITAVTNQAVTLSAVTPKIGTAPASVRLLNLVVWSFNGSGNIADAGATVAGVAVAPAALKAGMKCVLNGSRGTATGNIIKTLAC